MARVPYLGPDDLEEHPRELLGRNPINLFRALANNPGAMRQWFEFGEWIRWDGQLDPRLRELAILQVGASAKSPYEFSHHVVIGRRFGVTDEDLGALVEFTSGMQTEHFTELEHAVLVLAREMTESGVVDDVLWGTLSAALDVAELVELVVVVGFYNMVVRVLAAIELDVEPDFQAALAFLPGSEP